MLAFVLSRKDFREHDQIITLYTLEQGKVEALARGIKKSTSKNSSALEPFALVDAEIIPGKEIVHLTTAHIVEPYNAIHVDFAKLLVARYILSLTNELVDTHLPDKKIFNLLHATLAHINQSARVSTNVITHFALQLGVLLGFSPALANCLVCGVSIGAEAVLFDIAGGGAVHPHCKPASEYVVALNSAELGGLKVFADPDFTAHTSVKSQPKLQLVLSKFLAYHSQKNIHNWSSVDKLLA